MTIALGRLCTRCQEQRLLTEFYRSSSRKDGLNRWCIPCVKEQNRESYIRHREARRAKCKAWADENRDYRLERQLLLKYGMTNADYDALWESQGRGCAICGGSERDRRGRRLPVDHDHATGVVRGILCENCNKGIGNLQEDPTIFHAALRYLGHE